MYAIMKRNRLFVRKIEAIKILKPRQLARLQKGDMNVMNYGAGIPSLCATCCGFYSSAFFSAYSLRSFSCTSAGTSSYEENFIENDERPPVIELRAVE